MRTRVRTTGSTNVFDAVVAGVLAPIAWLLPERLWAPLGRAASIAVTRLRPGVTRARSAMLASVLDGRVIDRSLLRLQVDIMTAAIEERCQLLRARRPGGWRPRLRLVGEQHLERALAKGHGAVLWVCPFAYSDLVTKMALHRAGFAVTHLSAVSPDRWLHTAVETRYLKERIVAPADGSLSYLPVLEARLEANGLVAIRAGEGPVEVDFLGGSIGMASGPASLAVATEAALLPVLVVPGEAGGFDVVIEPPLVAAPGLTRPATPRHLAARYAARLESCVLAHPHLWGRWYSMHLPPTSRGAQVEAPDLLVLHS